MPLPTGALPTQAVRPKASITEQIVTNSFFISSAPFEILQTIIVVDSFQLVQKSHIPKQNRSSWGEARSNPNGRPRGGEQRSKSRLSSAQRCRIQIVRAMDAADLFATAGACGEQFDLRSLLRLVSPPAVRGCSSMVEQQPSKLMTRVRFPSPAPVFSIAYLKLLVASPSGKHPGKRLTKEWGRALTGPAGLQKRLLHGVSTTEPPQRGDVRAAKRR